MFRRPRSSAALAQWFFSTKVTGWQAMDAPSCVEIDAAVSAGSATTTLSVGGQTYDVDLASMTQRNRATNTKRRIRSKPDLCPAAAAATAGAAAAGAAAAAARPAAGSPPRQRRRLRGVKNDLTKDNEVVRELRALAQRSLRSFCTPDAKAQMFISKANESLRNINSRINDKLTSVPYPVSKWHAPQHGLLQRLLYRRNYAGKVLEVRRLRAENAQMLHHIKSMQRVIRRALNKAPRRRASEQKKKKDSGGSPTSH